jgi:hypothetical protein
MGGRDPDLRESRSIAAMPSSFMWRYSGAFSSAHFSIDIPLPAVFVVVVMR